MIDLQKMEHLTVSKIKMTKVNIYITSLFINLYYFKKDGINPLFVTYIHIVSAYLVTELETMKLKSRISQNILENLFEKI